MTFAPQKGLSIPAHDKKSERPAPVCQYQKLYSKLMAAKRSDICNGRKSSNDGNIDSYNRTLPGKDIPIEHAQLRKDPVFSLPTEISRLVLSCLPSDSLARACAVSRSWRQAARDPLLWRWLFRNDYWERDTMAPTTYNTKSHSTWQNERGSISEPVRQASTTDWATIYSRRRATERNWRFANHNYFRLPQKLFPFEGHTGPILTMRKFGQYLVTGGADGTVRLWDLDTRRLWGPPMHGHQGCVTAVDIVSCQSSDSRLHFIVSGSNDGELIFWDMHGQQMRSASQLEHHGHIVTIRSSYCRLLTGYLDGSIKVWTWTLDISGIDPFMVSLTHTRSLEGHNGPVAALNFIDGYVSSHSSSGHNKVWDPATGRCVHEVHDCYAVPLCHLDGQKITGGIPPTTRVLGNDLTSDFAVFQDPPDLITSAQTIQDSEGCIRTIVSVCRNGVLAVWKKHSDGTWSKQHTLNVVPAKRRTRSRSVLGYGLKVQADEQMWIVSSRSDSAVRGWDFSTQISSSPTTQG